MKVAVASFEFEGNTLSDQLHRREDFARKVLAEGAGVIPATEGRDLAVTGGIETLQVAGFTVHPVLVAHGGSGGRVEGTFYRETRDRIITGIAALTPLDGVFLALHGAMISEGEDDPEGEILWRLREALGPDVPIAASLDLHAHVTPRMVEAATILVGYETYPHVDAHSTGVRAAQLLVETLLGKVRPTMRLKRLDALLPVAGGATNGDMPMAQLRVSARKAEQERRVLSASYFPVQPWLDIPDLGIAGLAITNDDAAGAEQVADAIVREMWDRRREFEIPLLAPDEAVLRALGHSARRVLISDAPDCVGGGAPGDAPAVLAALLRHATHVPAAVLVVDPPAAAAAKASGIGATLRTELGSKLDPRFHPPVEVEAVVESLHDGHFVYGGGISAGTPGNMGNTAVLRVGQLRIVVPTFATYEYADEQYRAVGIDIGSCRIIALKNPMNFRTMLDEETDWLMISGAGPTTPSLESIDWRVKQRPFWPCDDLPQPRYLGEHRQ
ncbi:M81 family metallopeptidase [Muricoccus aerilatus]|uniref:M81 family metallopeptidase n=1 Tax=Muricoccus aerilatus TaxID=452982 RepID=UPI0014700CFB|nr:M81 family metallopeptidase [Roseomonas aerilata]